jgi:hypothetical protein
MRASASVWQEIDKARSRILKTLEESQDLLNRMRGHPACTSQELVSMRAAHAGEQEALAPPQRLRSLLDEEQFVYLWNYSLVLLSNLSGRLRSGAAAATTRRTLEKKLTLSEKARTLYRKGDLDKAMGLVSRIITDLAP